MLSRRRDSKGDVGLRVWVIGSSEGVEVYDVGCS